MLQNRKNKKNCYFLSPGFIAFCIFFIMVFLFSSTVSGNADFQSFTLACPFYSVSDTVPGAAFLTLWESGTPVGEAITGILVTEATYEMLSAHFQTRSAEGVLILPAEAIRNILSDPRGTRCAVVPTDELLPNWKRVAVDDQPAPWDKDYRPAADFLSVPRAGAANFDSGKVTSVLITGTTALTRTTAYKMFVNGMTYPGEAVAEVFAKADLRHVSNESAFWSLCPEPVYSAATMQFCSPLDLFQYLGVNVVELTGNHLRDYDWPPLLETLDLLAAKGFGFYGAGRTVEEAALPYLVTHNQNRFAFVGCNVAGPDHVFVSETLPGVRQCDFDTLSRQIRDLTDRGYLVIATIQYYERYSRLPSEQQITDFNRLADAGAVVVTGSQAHYPQIMEPGETRFIHYGLGNLFFDQMDRPVAGTRQEFLDKFIFYDGRLLQVELITALLYDYAQPRLMLPEEREAFLKDVFSYAE